MKTLEIASADFPFEGYYARKVLEAGHESGTLSGAALQGKARKYGAWYYRQRGKVEAWVKQAHAIESRVILLDSRWTRVWTTKDGEPVQITLI